jgi:hypothetical protein
MGALRPLQGAWGAVSSMSAGGVLLPATNAERVEAARRALRHVIADIHFASKVIPSEMAPVSCSCSWRGTVAEFRLHSDKRVHRA